VTYATSVSGHNGRNESYVGFSSSVDLEFFDQYNNPITVVNVPTPIQLWIPRNVFTYTYDYANVTNQSLSSAVQIMPILVTANSTNASIHIQLRAKRPNVGYLFLFKFGATPILNSTYKNYDYWKIFCPNSTDHYNLTSSNGTLLDAYYLFFLDQSQVNGYKGFLGYGLRELNDGEFTKYCIDKQNSTSPPVLSKMANSTSVSTFRYDFEVLAYSGGCYYYDTSAGKWDNEGLNIFADTNLLYTHCNTNHLTQFAGGLTLLPNKINFSYAFANASPLSNPIIYAVVITVLVLYVLLSILAFQADKKDKERMSMVILEDNLVGENYFYEVIVFTGTNKEAASDSKVKVIINGDINETDVRNLESSQRAVFRRGGVDSFIMAVNRPLGNLNFIKIWHDNSGQSDLASWFLKYVIVHDLQTREQFYFLCDNWLAVERGDGKIDRTLAVSNEKQVANYKYRSKDNMSDGHIWLSVIAKPVQSTFSRLDRVGVCFVLISVFMFVNILYYGVTSSSIDGYTLGPFNFSAQQVGYFRF
jgi:hypothetical protein